MVDVVWGLCIYLLAPHKCHNGSSVNTQSWLVDLVWFVMCCWCLLAPWHISILLARFINQSSQSVNFSYPTATSMCHPVTPCQASPMSLPFIQQLDVTPDPSDCWVTINGCSCHQDHWETSHWPPHLEIGRFKLGVIVTFQCELLVSHCIGAVSHLHHFITLFLGVFLLL